MEAARSEVRATLIQEHNEAMQKLRKQEEDKLQEVQGRLHAAEEKLNGVSGVWLT